MKSRSLRLPAFTSRAGKNCTLGLFLFAGGVALAQYQGTPACQPR